MERKYIYLVGLADEMQYGRCYTTLEKAIQDIEECIEYEEDGYYSFDGMCDCEISCKREHISFENAIEKIRQAENTDAIILIDDMSLMLSKISIDD
jgi:hypothetical protein